MDLHGITPSIRKSNLFEDRLTYLHAQEAAKQSKLGVWVETESMPPWDWRKADRQ